MENNRQSHHINRKPAANLHHATRQASAIGCNLNRFVTINTALLGIPNENVSAAFQKILSQRFSPWLRRNSANLKGVSPTYVWVIEATGGTAIHWAVHIPSRMKAAFARKLTAWVEEISRCEFQKNVICEKSIYNVVGLKRYFLKGTEENYAKIIGIIPSKQGVVTGKRSGFSRNLGPTARKKSGYRVRRILGFSSSTNKLAG